MLLFAIASGPSSGLPYIMTILLAINQAKNHLRYYALFFIPSDRKINLSAGYSRCEWYKGEVILPAKIRFLHCSA